MFSSSDDNFFYLLSALYAQVQSEKYQRIYGIY